jgi:SAM-dependent methyltransferase
MREVAPQPGDGHYIGSELELFAEARRWKAYWSRDVARWVRGDVLDVGAGLGATARVFAHAAGITSYLALEPDAELVARMQQAAAGDFPPRFEALAGTIESLPPSRRFDSILYIDVLEHIADDRGELERARAHLAPGGRILVLAPAHGFLYSPFDAAIGHERRYDRRTLRAAVPAGLEVERMHYLDSVGMLASLANRLLLRSAMPTRGQIALWDRWMVPTSRWLDPATGHALGKSLVAVLKAGGE